MLTVLTVEAPYIKLLEPDNHAPYEKQCHTAIFSTIISTYNYQTTWQKVEVEQYCKANYSISLDYYNECKVFILYISTNNNIQMNCMFIEVVYTHTDNPNIYKQTSESYTL